MNLPALLLVALLCVLLALRWSRRKALRNVAAPWPFYAKRPLASPDQVLYQRLVNALPGYLVLDRVELSRVLGVKRGFDAARWNKRLGRLHYDFVVCAPDATVLAAIVLEDPSRNAAKPTPTDLTRERASKAAGVCLLHWQAKALPGEAEIQEQFGAPYAPYAEGSAASANQSWWPPLASGTRPPPLH